MPTPALSGCTAIEYLFEYWSETYRFTEMRIGQIYWAPTLTKACVQLTFNENILSEHSWSKF